MMQVLTQLEPRFYKRKTIIIDEMDEMLNLGFRKQITNILELVPAKRQNLLFSATITEDVEKLINDYFNEPVRVEAAPTGTPLEINSLDCLIAHSIPTMRTSLLSLQLSTDFINSSGKSNLNTWGNICKCL